MKKCLFVALYYSSFIFAGNNFSIEDKYQIKKKLEFFSHAVINKDYKAIELLIPSEFPGLIEKVQNEIVSYNSYAFIEMFSDVNVLPNGDVKVISKYKASNFVFGVNGFCMFFIFRKIENSWYIVDTNFDKGFSFLGLNPFFWKVVCFSILTIGVISVVSIVNSGLKIRDYYRKRKP